MGIGLEGRSFDGAQPAHELDPGRAQNDKAVLLLRGRGLSFMYCHREWGR
jgi:hypothetical protein